MAKNLYAAAGNLEAYLYEPSRENHESVTGVSNNLHDLIDLRDTHDILYHKDDQLQLDLEQWQYENSDENPYEEQIIITEESDVTSIEQSCNSQSKSISNQEIFSVLDSELSNKPRDLYVD